MHIQQEKNPEPNHTPIPESIWRYSRKHINTIRIDKGDYIYLPDDLSVHIYILQQGAVKIGGYSRTGKEVMFDCILPNEFFGNLKFLNGDFFTEYARPLVDVEVIEINVHQFKELVRQDVDIANWVHAVMALRWYRAESRLFRISAEKPIDRVRYLLPLLNQQLCDVHGRPHTMTDLLGYQDVADLCGLSRQSAARYLKELSGQINR